MLKLVLLLSVIVMLNASGCSEETNWDTECGAESKAIEDAAKELDTEVITDSLCLTNMKEDECTDETTNCGMLSCMWD